MWRRKKRSDAGSRRDLVEETEAFLQGTLVEWHLRHDRCVPTWAWTNLLAHGTRDQLIGATRANFADSSRWAQARQYLAAELLDRVPEPSALRRLQTRVLVPLEFELAARTLAREQEPSEWLLVVLDRLVGQQPARSPRADHT